MALAQELVSNKKSLPFLARDFFYHSTAGYLTGQSHPVLLQNHLHWKDYWHRYAVISLPALPTPSGLAGGGGTTI